MIQSWEMDKVKALSTSEIKNMIWREVACGQPVPGCLSVTALRLELLNRGGEPVGYHET